MKQLGFLLAVLAIAGTSFLWAQSWTSLDGPPLATSVQDITVTYSGSSAYIAEAGYVVKSTNAGISWAGTLVDFEQPLLVQVKLDDGNRIVAAKEGLAAYSSDAGGSWSLSIQEEDLNPLRLVNVITNKNYMLMGVAYVEDKASIRYSTNSGSDWSHASFSNRITDVWDLAAYPTADGKRDSFVWAAGSDPDGTPDGESQESEATTSGFWVSADNGVTWAACTFGNANLRSIVVVPTTWPQDYTLLVVEHPSSGSDILWRNVVSGEPNWWSQISLADSPAQIYLVRRNHSDGKIYAATSLGAYVSTNNGSSFTRVNNGLGSDTDVLTVEPGGSSGLVYIGTARGVYKSTDSGSNWTKVTTMNASTAEGGSTVWSASRDNGYVGLTTDGGSTWSFAYLSSAGATVKSEHAFRTQGNGHLFVAGSHDDKAALYRSTNGGTDFDLHYNPSTNTGESFYRIRVDLTASDDYVYLAGGATLSGTWKNLFFSSDGGATWQAYSFSLGSTGTVAKDHIVINSSTRYAILSTGEVLKTVNSGQTWTSVLGALGIGYSLAISPGVTNTIYAGRSGGLWKSTDSGTNWTQKTSSAAVKRIVMHPGYPSSSDYLFTLEENGGTTTVRKSTDGGSSFTSISSGLPKVNDIQTGPTAGYLYAATEKGIYRYDIQPAPVKNLAGSVASGNHPHLAWDANPEADLDGYKIYSTGCMIYMYNLVTTVDASTTSYTDLSQTVHSGGDGDFFYYVAAVDAEANMSIPSNEVSFECDTREQKAVASGEPELPTTIALRPNRPNPFNPSTELRFDLPEPATVSLGVYDLLGRKVADLASGSYEAGYHKVVWNAADMASGVYFARFSVVNELGKAVYTKTNKLVLIK